ncbi:hypothetical protein [Treponema endosymbiont of Eucomonympha sp.]|uniref:hypothetical protein n=1 Tax=Treponema endosymbiont of Eucomonympha sp. TaxID=1580831 RepID=UPI00139688C2|nr:hypothetical protein [Treponema endosymbiont of Eucomonympha sp.]
MRAHTRGATGRNKCLPARRIFALLRGFYEPLIKSYESLRGFYEPLIKSYESLRGFYASLIKSYESLRGFYGPLIKSYERLRGFYESLIKLYERLGNGRGRLAERGKPRRFLRRQRQKRAKAHTRRIETYKAACIIPLCYLYTQSARWQQERLQGF